MNRATRLASRRRQEFPDVVELIVVAIRAGLSPTQAVRTAAPLVGPAMTPAFEAFESRLARGASFADALGAMGDAVGPSARPIVEAMVNAERYGLPLAPMLDRLVDEARRERRHQAAEAARRLPVALAFPLVTCSLPSFVLLAIVPAVLGAVRSLTTSLP